MPINTAIRIIIAVAGQTDQFAPPSQYLFVNQTIHLWKLPSSDTGAFALRVSDGRGVRETRLAAVESEALGTLLAQLPSHGMDSKVMSFDGVTFELIVEQAEQSLSFHWQNEDWRYASRSPIEQWERVAAVADYALRLAKETGATP